MAQHQATAPHTVEMLLAGCRLVLATRNAYELACVRHDLTQRGAGVLVVPCDVTNQEQACS
jgi:hypothetical protein